MSDRFLTLMRALDKSTSLGIGIIIVVIGLLLRFFPPIEVFVELWLFSLAGTVVLGLGLLMVAVGLISFLAGNESVGPSDERRPITQKQLEKKHHGVSLADSSAGVHAVEALANVGKPLSRKEIAEGSGLTTAQVAYVLKSFVSKGYVAEFQVRGASYYALVEKGLRLCEDIRATSLQEKSPKPDGRDVKLKESWKQRRMHGNNMPYYDRQEMAGFYGLKPVKQRILRQQVVLIFGFLGGLFLNFGVNLGACMPTAMPWMLALTMVIWLVSTIFSARKVGGALGIMTLSLAWVSGFIVPRGDPLMSLGIVLLMGSVTIGAFAA